MLADMTDAKTTPSSVQRIELIEVLRGFAAGWVLLHHAVMSAEDFLGPTNAPAFLRNGYLGVDFFFVLSGFIIALSASRLIATGRGISDYARARVLRVYVPYLPVSAALIVAYTALPDLSEGDRSFGLLTSLTLLPSDLPPALSVAWTLVHEIIFYALFSLIFVSRRLLVAVIAVWGAAILAAHSTGAEIGRFWTYFLSPLNLCFILGVAAYFTSQAFSAGRRAAIVLAIASVALVGTFAADAAPNRVMVSAGFAGLIFAIATTNVTLPRSLRGLLILGSASYAIYLVHNPVLSVIVRVVRRLDADASPIMGLVVISLLALLAGLAYWALFERRALPVARKLWSRSPARGAEA